MGRADATAQKPGTAAGASAAGAASAARWRGRATMRWANNDVSTAGRGGRDAELHVTDWTRESVGEPAAGHHH